MDGSEIGTSQCLRFSSFPERKAVRLLIVHVTISPSCDEQTKHYHVTKVLEHSWVSPRASKISPSRHCPDLPFPPAPAKTFLPFFFCVIYFAGLFLIDFDFHSCYRLQCSACLLLPGRRFRAGWSSRPASTFSSSGLLIRYVCLRMLLAFALQLFSIRVDRLVGTEVWRRRPRIPSQGYRYPCEGRHDNIGPQGSQRLDRVSLWLAQDHKRFVFFGFF